MLTRRLTAGLLPALGQASSRLQTAWAQPLLAEGAARQSSTFSAQDVEAAQAAPVDESWWREVLGGEGGGEGGSSKQEQHHAARPRRFDRLDAPIDAPRSLRDYQKMVFALSRRKRAYLIRDVVDEMWLNGIRPDKFVLQTGLFACMKARKLGDAMFFFEEMQRRGMEPDSAAYSSAISACGRGGQLGRMLELRDEMLRRGLGMTHNTRLAMLHAFADAGKMQATRQMFDEIVASGHAADEFAYAGLANCYRHLPQRFVPANVEQLLLDLIEEFKAAQAASRERAQQAGSADAEAQGEQPGGRSLLVVYNAVINSLAELGRHNAAVALFKGMGDEGLAPDHTTYSNIIRSYMQQALGRHRQPSSERLTALLDEKLQEVDFQPYEQAVLADDPALAAALEAAAAAAAAQQQGSTAAEPQAAATEADAAAAEVAVGLGDEEEEQPGAAALRTLTASQDAAAEAGSNAEADAPFVEGAAAGQEHQEQQEQRRQQQRAAPWSGLNEAQLRRAVRAQALGRARSHLRFQVFREHLDVDAWYEALHIFQEVLDRGLLWGPDITYAMLKASLDVQAAGVEHAMEVAHTVMDTFDRQGLFVDVENGTEVLLLAVRRDVADLSLAHRIYDNMRATQRVPKTPCLFKYMRAMAQREPESRGRLLDVCSCICSDPDRSPAMLAMKKEAYQRRQQLLASMPEQQRRQHQQRQQQRGRQ
ncbi:hypothetical protein ABPG75_001911 [Micractinium tetrahymenae]